MPRIEGTATPSGHTPMVLVSIALPDGMVAQGLALVDSGADVTIVPMDILAAFGVKWEDLEPASQGVGAGGVFETRWFETEVRFRDWVFARRVMVAVEGQLPHPLLGRHDFFRTFVVRFSWHRDPPYVDIDPVTSQPVRTKSR